MNFIVPMARFPDQSESTKVASFTSRQGDVSPVEFQALPGPEVRALRAKIMRHVSFLGPGGHEILSARAGLFRCRGARPGAEPPASLCGNTIGPPAGIFFPPMLFPRNALTSGPQACFLAEKRIAKVKGGKNRQTR
jgi:hypothetical protein